MVVLASILSCSCARPAPVVRNVTVHTTVEPHRCTLPATPPQAVIVGYPNATPTEVLATKSDMAGVLTELAAIRLYLAAIADCISSP